MPASRRRARVIALQALYEVDCAKHDSEEIVKRLLEGNPLPEKIVHFALGLIQGVIAGRDKIDEIIQKNAPVWPLKQMAIIDRNILRIAIYEVLFSDETPVKAAIDEAVEIAKAFGSDNSPKFINGVLGSVVKQEKPLPSPEKSGRKEAR
ncbi:MAG: transcription antitermination factor NusB [Chloroflexi bacterium]|nr:transcription antitermination factor NusB [Chloroflexota bacterium]